MLIVRLSIAVRDAFKSHMFLSSATSTDPT